MPPAVLKILPQRIKINHALVLGILGIVWIQIQAAFRAILLPSTHHHHEKFDHSEQFPFASFTWSRSVRRVIAERNGMYDITIWKLPQLKQLRAAARTSLGTDQLRCGNWHNCCVKTVGPNFHISKCGRPLKNQKGII